MPSVALWLTSIIIQLIVISTYWSRDAFSLMLNLTSATTLIPYLFVAAYGLMIAQRGETYEVRPEERQRDLILAALAVVYTLFMIYAGGLKFILLSAVLFAPGTVLYFIARREQGKAVFDKTSDWVIFGVIVAAAHLRRLRSGDRLHLHLTTPRSSTWQRQRQSQAWRRHKRRGEVRRAFRSRPAAQGDGLRAGRGAQPPHAAATATSCCSTTCCGSRTPSATTSTS